MNRSLALLSATTICLVLTGCPGGASISTDYDHNANFSQFHTFSFAHVTTDNPLYEQRIRNEISKDLQAKGLQVAQRSGDLVVTAVGAIHNRKEYQTFYDDPGFGYYWGGFGPGFGTTRTTVQHYKVGTLVVDFYNGSSKQLLWRGIAKRGVSGSADQNRAGVDSAIDKMLDRFPPA